MGFLMIGDNTCDFLFQYFSVSVYVASLHMINSELTSSEQFLFAKCCYK